MSKFHDILLESGTNELEIVEFTVNKNYFAINVMKVREIVNPLQVTLVPQSHPHVEGIIELRGEVLPVIDIAKVLGLDKGNDFNEGKFIVAEFNNQKVVFRVDNVTHIYRISWEDIEKPSVMYQNNQSLIIGVVKFDTRMLLMLDYEKMIVDISPEVGFNVEDVQKLGVRERSDKKIVIVEDSPLLRALLDSTLKEAGYENLTFFDNGKEALTYLQGLKQQVYDNVNLVITDIEMPQMDGHHLTKRIREDNNMKNLPVIIFSSLITDDLRHKGEKVGATAQVSKPEIGDLVKLIDKHIM